MRASADRKHREWGPDSLFIRESTAGVLATIAWLRGQGTAPATGLARQAAEEGAVRAEWLAARDLEHGARGTDEAIRFGAVARTIAWYLLDPTADAPA